MQDFPNLNTVLLGLLTILVLGLKTVDSIRTNRKDLKSENDDIRGKIIDDYETRLKQVEQSLAQITKENQELKGQIEGLRDLPLKRIDDNVTMIFKAQAVLSETQTEIIRLLTAKVVENGS